MGQEKSKLDWSHKEKDCLSFGFVWFDLCIGNIYDRNHSFPAS